MKTWVEAVFEKANVANIAVIGLKSQSAVNRAAIFDDSAAKPAGLWQRELSAGTDRAASLCLTKALGNVSQQIFRTVPRKAVPQKKKIRSKPPKP